MIRGQPPAFFRIGGNHPRIKRLAYARVVQSDNPSLSIDPRVVTLW